MFGLGMMEIGLIIALAVMLFPPKELPKLARTIARVYGQVRRTAEDFRSAVLEDEDLREPLDEIKGAYNEARFEVRDAERKARQQLAKAQMDLRMATARRLQAERLAKAKEDEESGAESLSSSGAESESGSDAGESGGESHGHASEGDRAEGEPGGGSASAVPSAANSSEVEQDGPVAGADPRVIAARRSGAYTPRVAVDESAPDDDRDGEPREGVA